MSSYKLFFTISTFYIFTLIFFVLLTFNLSFASRSGYGEKCDDALKCNTQAWLRCSENGTCDCKLPDVMLYDRGNEVCVAKSGERCKYRLENEAEVVPGVRVTRNLKEAWYEEIGCTAKSECSPDGVCICDKGHYETPEGTCKPQKDYNQTCRTPMECSGQDNLVCIDGRCVCDPENSMWSKEECVGLAGSPCINFRCAENTKCSTPNPFTNFRYQTNNQGWNSGKPPMKRSSNSSPGICECMPGFSRSYSTKECLGSYRHHCSPNSGSGTRCDSDRFACVDGLCNCKNMNHQIFDQTLNLCRGLVGGPCLTNINGTLGIGQCIEGAVCVKRYGSSYEGHCECKPGYIENENGMCNIGFGTQCPAIQELNEHADHLYCDKLTPLNCIDGACACSDSLTVYDSTRRKCVGLIGSRCTNTENEKIICVEGGECKQPNKSLSGRCVCQEGYVEGKSRNCEGVKDSENAIFENVPSQGVEEGSGFFG